jgi:phosphate/sulfate permease
MMTGVVALFANLWCWITTHATVLSAVISAIAAAIIAGFTVSLVRATNQQAKITESALRLASDEFSATHRPRVIVRTFRTVELVKGADPYISFAYVNTGDLPAKMIAIQTSISTTSTIPTNPIFLTEDEVNGIVLESGDIGVFQVTPGGDFHFQRGFSEEVGFTGQTIHQADTYLFGCVIYEDGKGRRRETGFGRVSKGSTGHWAVIKDSEYEYQD